MQRFTTIAKLAAAALLLAGLTACTTPATGPDMADYSYSPTTGNATVATTPGIESF